MQKGHKGNGNLTAVKCFAGSFSHIHHTGSVNGVEDFIFWEVHLDQVKNFLFVRKELLIIRNIKQLVYSFFLREEKYILLVFH